MRRLVSSLLFLLLLIPPAAALGQATAAAPVAAAKSGDVASVDAIMKAVYDVISGPAGQRRDWDRMRSLFAPGARLIPTGKDQEGKPRMRTWTLEEYIAAAGPSLEKDGFFEVEVGRVQERYGNIVHLMSAYESRRKTDDPKPFARGVNSFQLWNDGTRWWVVTIFWEGETPGNPIPSKYLKK
jgi:hypothetical protein